MPLATASPRTSSPRDSDEHGRVRDRSRPRWAGRSRHGPPGAVGQRRPVLAAAGALVVVVCGALGALVANQAGRRDTYLVAAQPVAAGSMITTADLATVALTPAAGLDAIPATDAAQVAGTHATTALDPGTLLAPGDLAAGASPPAGTALVGTSLASDQMPAGLAVGQAVLVVLTGTPGLTGGTGTGAPATAGSRGPTGASTSGASSAPAGGSGPAVGVSRVPSPSAAPGSLLTLAVVVAIGAGGGSGAGASASASTEVTLQVPVVAATAVTAASAAGDVSLAAVAPSRTGSRSGGSTGSPRAAGKP